MSEANVELVRRTYSDWARGDFTGTRELLDPEVVFESFMPDSTERVIFRGPEGIEEFMREFLAQWRDYRLFGEEFRQVGNETVLVEGHQSARGRQSGVEVESPTHSVWTFRDGKVIRLVFEFDWQKALDAAGLPGA